MRRSDFSRFHAKWKAGFHFRTGEGSLSRRGGIFNRGVSQPRTLWVAGSAKPLAADVRVLCGRARLRQRAIRQGGSGKAGSAKPLAAGCPFGRVSLWPARLRRRGSPKIGAESKIAAGLSPEVNSLFRRFKACSETDAEISERKKAEARCIKLE